MNDRILVKVSANESSISFQTVTKKRKSPHRFYILRSELERLRREGSVITYDLHSFARLRYDPDKGVLSIRFIWLSASDRGEFTGWEQTVRLPYDTLAEFAARSLVDGESKQWKALSLAEKEDAQTGVLLEGESSCGGLQQNRAEQAGTLPAGSL